MKIKKNFILFFLLFVMLLAGCSSSQSPQTPGDLYPDDTKAVSAETTYGKLQFPEKWKEYISNEVIKESDSETVQYWVKVGNHEKVHVFDIVFGEEGYYVGTIKGKDGNADIDVNVVSYNIELDDSWTDEETQTVYAIADDINYLLVKLEEIEGFEPVE